tara:strand:+ start:2274 stop:3056 length:783 start_codon:yes stop_codon:yes gene_type:complete
MGLLLKVGVNIDLIKSALISFLTIFVSILLINLFPFIKDKLPNYSIQLAGLIGNTSFLGIPVALAILSTSTINFTIGFDLGTTLFSWIFGPYFLKKELHKNSNLSIKRFFLAIFESPASRGILGVLTIYLFRIDEILGNILWIPARFVIFLAIIVVGTRLGIITNQNKILFKLSKEIKFSIFLKLILFPLIIYLICIGIGFSKTETTALVLQAGTPTAISTILMAEAYKVNQDIAAKTLFASTIISLGSIPLIISLMRLG